VIIQIGFGREDRAFGVPDLAGVARQNLDPTCRASRIAAAAMQNIDAVVLDRQDKLFADLGLKSNWSAGGIGGDLFHQIEISC
jgi:hypothetical protein